MELWIATTWDGRPLPAADQVRLQLDLEGPHLRVEVEAPFSGDPAPPTAPGPTWGLWEHEVVELFVAGPGERYTEIELGPYGHHLVLQLAGVRAVVARELPLRFEARIEGDRWKGIAWLDRGLLPSGPHRINATAIRGVGEARGYFAWAPMPGPAPDFHRLEAWRPVVLGD